MRDLTSPTEKSKASDESFTDYYNNKDPIDYYSEYDYYGDAYDGQAAYPATTDHTTPQYSNVHNDYTIFSVDSHAVLIKTITGWTVGSEGDCLFPDSVYSVTADASNVIRYCATIETSDWQTVSWLTTTTTVTTTTRKHTTQKTTTVHSTKPTTLPQWLPSSTTPTTKITTTPKTTKRVTLAKRYHTRATPKKPRIPTAPRPTRTPSLSHSHFGGKCFTCHGSGGSTNATLRACAASGKWKVCPLNRGVYDLCSIELREEAPRRHNRWQAFAQKEIRQLTVGCMGRQQCTASAQQNFIGPVRILHECGTHPEKSICRSCVKPCVNVTSNHCTLPMKGKV